MIGPELIELLIGLVILGAALYLVESLIPLARPVQVVIRVVVVILMLLLLLRLTVAI